MSTGIHTLVKRRKAAEKRVVVAAMRFAANESEADYDDARLADACARLGAVREAICAWKRAARKKLRAMRKVTP